jgi:hypothetical protein
MQLPLLHVLTKELRADANKGLVTPGISLASLHCRVAEQFDKSVHHKPHVCNL